MNNNSDNVRRIHEHRARTAKAGDAVGAIIATYEQTGEPLPAADLIADLDDEGWQALEVMTGHRLASPATRAAVVDAYRSRLALRARIPADPFAGLTDNEEF